MTSKAKVVDPEMQEEMIGLLTAISIVSKRLARKLTALARQETEGDKQDEQDG